MTECIQCDAPTNNSSGLCASCAASGQKTAALETSALPQAPGAMGGEKLEERIGPMVGDYELLELIARGGMGLVYRARQRSVQRLVALKMMLPGSGRHEASRRRFSLEAAAVANLDHPHIVPIYEVGEAEGHPYFTMKLVEGGTLAQHAEKLLDRPLEVARLMTQVARAVHFAHQRGILHRDLKPANILIDGDGRPQVADFGLARFSGQETNLTLPEAALGTPNYMAPEQARGRAGELTTAADVYSLGAILYHLLTGLPPFRAGTPLETLRLVTQDDPEPPRVVRPTTDRDLETICLKCLEKNPQDRYPSAEALAQDLERWLHHEPIAARPAGAYEHFIKWVRRRPATAAVALAGLLAAIGFVLEVNISRNRLQRQRDFAVQQEQTALRERARAQEIAARLAIQNADAEFSADNWKSGLAQLARLVHDSPSNSVAAHRLLFALTYRSFAPLTVPPFTHERALMAAEFSPDEKLVLTAGRDGTARIWDVATGKELMPPLRHAADLTRAHFSPDGRRIVTSSVDKTARIWDARTGESRHELHHDDRVSDVAFSPDGLWIATCSYDKTAKLWNAETGELKGEPLQFRTAVSHVRFSPDGKKLLVAASNKLIVWDIRAEKQIGEPVMHGGFIADAVFSPDGERFATASHDKSIRVWETATARPLTPGILHTGEVYTVRFSPDGQRLASAEFYLAAHLWDSRTGEELTPPLPHNDSVMSAEFSADGLRVVTSCVGKYLRVWDATTGRPISQPLRHNDMVVGAKFSADSRTVLSWSRDNTARLWDVQLGEALNVRLPHESGVAALAISPDGRRVATGTLTGMVRLWDVASGALLGGPAQDTNIIVQVNFSPDGQLLAVASGDGTLRIFNSETHQLVSKPEPHEQAPTIFAFSPSGGEVLSASWDGTGRVWHAQSGRSLTPPLVHKKSILSAHFSPDGKTIVTASHDGTAQLWNATTAQPIGPPLRHARPVWQAHFSPDGKYVVTAAQNNQAQIWDALTGEPRGKPLLHDAEVQQARFDPNGCFVLCGTREGMVHLWDANTLRPAAAPAKHETSIGHISFSPDGSRILSSSQDAARLWDGRTLLPLTGPLRHRKTLFRANFSPNGRWVATSGLDGDVLIWSLPPVPVPAPDWVATLAEVLAGQILTSEGLHETVPATELARLKQTIGDQAGSNFYARWARWFFAERSMRTISPFSDLTMPEYVQRRLEENTLESLHEAALLAPTNGLALARLAQKILLTQNPRALGEARHLSTLAGQWAPDQPEVCAIRQLIATRLAGE